MQEEITQRVVTLSIRMSKATAKLTEKALQKAIKMMLDAAHKPKRGKQTMRQLMKQNAGVSNIEITNDNIKGFESTAKKYGIDYSLKKVAGEQAHYLVFFKGRDVDAMTAAFQEFSAKKLNRDKKPSIRKALAAAKDKSKHLNQSRDKVKKLDKGREL
ncbi:MAG: PcfB family protein [Christensenellales bacterium]|nr:PcfB family protein [Christensenellales bacterium]